MMVSIGLVPFAMSCKTHAPLPMPDYVNLDRFMGLWYVHGYTPIVVDKEAYDATEHYEQDEKGRIQTTYRFRKGGHEGPRKEFTPVGFVHNTESNAEWRMQFLWPFKSTYIILHVEADYSGTIIAHPNRKLISYNYATYQTLNPLRTIRHRACNTDKGSHASN